MTPLPPPPTTTPPPPTAVLARRRKFMEASLAMIPRESVTPAAAEAVRVKASPSTESSSVAAEVRGAGKSVERISVLRAWAGAWGGREEWWGPGARLLRVPGVL